MSNNENILINGPINVVRLEGSIDSVKKVFYIFFDYHKDITMQVQCPTLDSIDVSKYIYSQCKEHVKTKNNNSIDIFFEIYKSEIIKKNYLYYRDRYIDEVSKIIKSSVDFKDNKIIYDEKFIDNRKIRLHYMDIRDVLLAPVMLVQDDLMNALNKISQLTDEDARILDMALNDAMEYLEYINDLLHNKKPKDLSFLPDNKDLENLRNIITKLVSRYNHISIKKKLNNHIINMYITYVKSIEKIVIRLKNLLAKYLEIPKDGTLTLIKELDTHKTYAWFDYSKISELQLEIHKELNKVSDIFLLPFICLVDLLLLRRSLDKDYITNIVTYTGALHSTNYIDILVRMFNFKITHASYSKYNDLKKINSTIGNLKDKEDQVDKLTTQELLFPPTITQCSDMTDFPTQFR